MSTCSITFDVLVDYHEGRVAAAVADQIHEHLVHCLTCQQRLDWLRQTLTTLSEIQADQHVSPDSMIHARALFSTRFPPFPIPTQTARLIFDNRRDPMPAGTRGREQNSVQMLYSTDGFDIDLWQEKGSGDFWYLIGQILPQDDGEAITPETALLIAEDGHRMAAVLDTDEFHVRAVPAGTYQIRLRFSDREIFVPDVVIGFGRAHQAG